MCVRGRGDGVGGRERKGVKEAGRRGLRLRRTTRDGERWQGTTGAIGDRWGRYK